ncbi:hypothetical protein VKS41_004419 [Umbelopsis sp. WA50703]
MSTAPDEAPKENVSKEGPSLGRTSPMLSHFCVYNPNLGAKSDENNKDQILFYTAKKVVPLDVKLRQVGLAQALVNFTSAFSPSQPVQTVHTQKARLVFLQPEPGFWLHMSIELGISRYQVRDSNGKLRTVTDYLDAELNDEAVEGILKVGYQMYKLLNGRFASFLANATSGSSMQSMRRLKHSIEEFFSDWIWKWDFDRLESMLFNSVFNGIPMQPIMRQCYLKIHKIAESILDDMKLDMKHVLVFNKDNATLIYHNPQLALSSVQLLRKLVIRYLERWNDMRKAEEWRKAADDHPPPTPKTDPKITSIKTLTKSFSQKNILGYFTSPSLKPTMPDSAPVSPTDSPEPSLAAALTVPPELASDTSGTPSPAPSLSLSQGIFLSGLLKSGIASNRSENSESPIIDVAKVYLDGDSYLHESHGTEAVSQELQEYYFVIYKHISQTLWCFLIPVSDERTESRLYDEDFYEELESLLIRRQIEDIATTIAKDVEKSKKTILPNTREVITRSTANVWVVGQRIAKKQLVEDAITHTVENNISGAESSAESCGSNETDESYEPLTEKVQTLSLSGTEIYLIAAKRDSTLVDVKDDIDKLADRMAASMYVD